VQSSLSAIRAPKLLLIGLIAVVFCLVLAGPRAVAAAPASSAALEWRPCGAIECATLAVPLDYSQPGGRQIDLALGRQKAKDQTDRIGSLLIDPGGPGASGVEFLRLVVLPQEIRDRFDIVGFDPRGVGNSSPLHCQGDVEKLAGLEPNPRSSAQWREIESAWRAFADGCGRHGGDLLAHLGTANVARDMDQIRGALGEPKLTYLGYSYGTAIGAVYADLFPDHVRALVLDGVLDTSLSSDQEALEQALGFEGALEHYLAACRAQQCLTANPADPAAALQELLSRAERAPIPAPSADRAAGPGEVLLAVVASLYSDRAWPRLNAALNRGLAGDASGLIRLVDDLIGRRPDGSFDNSFDILNAVSCIDQVFARDPAHYEALAAQMATVAPHFGSLFGAGGLACAFWPAPASPLQIPRGQGAPPILVIGTTGDPATPYAQAVAVSERLESAVLLTFRGEGHTAYLRGNQCIDSAVDAYLLSLQTPSADTACGDPALAAPLEVRLSGATPIPAPVREGQVTASATAVPPPLAPASAAGRRGSGWLGPTAAVILIAVVGCGALFLVVRQRRG
jgi:pimeloyl-ACP methyl ester carboxylesterase